jgi:hypothetical protein
MAKWDVARTAFTCGGGDHLVGQGEIYRVSQLPRKVGFCEACAIRLFQESAPDHINERTFLERLRDERIPTKQIQGPLMPRHVSQASFDPRGQRTRRRHGVVEAMRASTQTDWRMRRAGERE